MKNLTPFEEAIKTYLDDRASNDILFATSYADSFKNISDCCTYILNAVKSSKRTAFTDDEIHSMAVHYYTEEKIKVGAPVSNVRVVTSQSTSPRGEKPAIKQKRVKPVSTILQQSLFDDEL